jgi:DNA polymerase-3 subunit gamma/tau
VAPAFKVQEAPPVVVAATVPAPAPVPAVAPAPAPVVSPEPPPWSDEPSWVQDETAAASAPAEARQAAPEPAEPISRVAQIHVDQTPEQDRWMQVIETLFERGAVAGLVRELAWQAQCLGCSSADGQTVWRLVVERESLRQPSHRERLQAALTALLDTPQRIEVEAGVTQDSAARRDLAAKARRQAEAEDLIQADPVVRQLLATYPTARIVPGSIRPR